MACTRRRLSSSFTSLSRRLHPSFAHAIADDRRSGEPPPAQSPPSSRNFCRSVPIFGAPLPDRRTLAPLFLDPFQRRHFSSSEVGSSNTEFINDVSEVLTDTTIDATAAVVSAVPGEVAAAAADSFPPVAALQYLIDGVHSFTGLNWWAAIVLTTILIRGATIPLLLNTMKATVKLNAMRPELEDLKEQIQNSMNPESVKEGQRRMNELFKKHGVTPFTPLKGLFIQGPVFMSFFFAISNMVEKVPSFKEGGAFWFTDLTTPDPMYMLPVITSVSFLATVELNMQEGMEGNPMVKTMKNFSRVLALMTIPFTAHFPKAIFCYWITSNIFSLGYGFVLRRPPVRKFLKLPDLVPQPPTNPAPQSSFPFFGGSNFLAPKAAPPPPPPSPPAEEGKFANRRSVSSSAVSQRIRSLEKTVKARSKTKKKT